jgi:hypothetical protein
MKVLCKALGHKWETYPAGGAGSMGLSRTATIRKCVRGNHYEPLRWGLWHDEYGLPVHPGDSRAVAADTASDSDYAMGCGCRRNKVGAWSGCPEHPRPGGYESWTAYQAAWVHVECSVCHRLGFEGQNDFEMIGFDPATQKCSYAHELCLMIAR